MLSSFNKKYKYGKTKNPIGNIKKGGNKKELIIPQKKNFPI